MTEQEPQAKKTPVFYVENWKEANQIVNQLTEGGTPALGSWYQYPEDFTLNYMDSWSGEGMGYAVWENENGKHKAIAGIVHIGKKPVE